MMKPSEQEAENMIEHLLGRDTMAILINAMAAIAMSA